MIRQYKVWTVLLISLVAVALVFGGGAPTQAAGTVGNGTPASCTENALRNAIEGGGLVTFNCGPDDHTITITKELFFQDHDATLDGGDKITLKGTPGVHIIRFRTWGINDVARTLTLKNMTIRDAYRSGSQQAANGAAVYVTNNSAIYPDDMPTLIVQNVTFINNVSVQTNKNVNGYDYGGGAIMVWGGELIVENSTFTNNRSEGGGGGAIHILSSNVTIRDSLFKGNEATTVSNGDMRSGWGGAFYVDGAHPNNGTIEIYNSTFRDNKAGQRGGFAYIDLYRHRNQSMIIDGSRFIGNRSHHPEFTSAGALVTHGINIGQGGQVDVTITNSLFQDNVSRGESRGGEGGAIVVRGNNLTIGNSTFIGNRAEGECANCWNATGGMIFVDNSVTSPVKIINSTIVDSYAGWGPGAISGTKVRLSNSILANNVAYNLNRGGTGQQTCRDPFTGGGGGNIQFPINDGDTACLPGITEVNPLLGVVTGNTISLLPDSPAIDQGNPNPCANDPINGVDANGTVRPQGAGCDIGAYEHAENRTETEILTNGGMEIDTNADKTPDGWNTPARPGTYKTKCNKRDRPNGKPDKIFAREGGECAAMLKRKDNRQGKIRQTLDLNGVNLNAGDLLTLRLWGNARNNGSGKAKLVVKYTDGTKNSKVTRDIVTGDGWVQTTGAVLLDSNAVEKVKLVIRFNGQKGKLFVDDVSVTQGVLAGSPGTMPLPPIPLPPEPAR